MSGAAAAPLSLAAPGVAATAQVRAGPGPLAGPGSGQGHRNRPDTGGGRLRVLSRVRVAQVLGKVESFYGAEGAREQDLGGGPAAARRLHLPLPSAARLSAAEPGSRSRKAVLSIVNWPRGAPAPLAAAGSQGACCFVGDRDSQTGSPSPTLVRATLAKRTGQPWTGAPFPHPGGAESTGVAKCPLRSKDAQVLSLQSREASGEAGALAVAGPAPSGRGLTRAWLLRAFAGWTHE
nr:PREDICTED: transcription initiation factor TFIID subunit 4-like [Equus przewalskii]